MGLLKKIFAVENMLPGNLEHEELPSSSSMYKEYLLMALPSVLEMVLMGLINMMDTIMVSSIGTDAVAAVGLVGQPRMIMLCFFFATNMGITAVVARRKGEGRREDANKVMRNSILIIIALSIVLMAVLLPLAEPLMRFAGAEEGRTLEDSTLYFLILGYSLPFNAISMGICAAQRGIGNTKLTMNVNIVSNLVNILFNWLLINGIGPFPQLGVKGAAIASDIGIITGFVLSVYTILHGKVKNGEEPFLKLSLRDDWRPDKQSIKDVMFVAKSSMIEQLAFRIGFFSYAKIVAGLGTDAFASHQIVCQFMTISFNFADGFSIAGTSLVGQMLGRKRKDLAHIYGRLASRFSFMLSIVIAAVCVIFRKNLVSMFISENASPGVQELAELVMIVLAVIQPFQMVATVISGCLRGAGDVKYTARVMFLTIAFMRPVLSLLAVWLIGTKLGRQDIALIGAWAAALADMATRMVLVKRRYDNGGWRDIVV